jgi:hypothetical protein
MPASTAVRGSTQDGSTGTQVAVATNEVNSGHALAAVVVESNKTTYSETSRTGLTGADAPTGGDLTTGGFAGSSGANLFDLGNAQNVAVRATCGTASATLTGRIIFYDGSNNAIGMSRLLSFTADATLRLGNATGDFVSIADLVEAGAARKARFFVASVSSGTWAVHCRPV